MNPMLQRHCAKFIYIVPDGLRELMSDISREVIRSQPEQVYTFIADYLDALMITRENARIATRLVDYICEIAETTVEVLLNIGISRVAADAVVTLIQQTFRGYLEQKKKFSMPMDLEPEDGYYEDNILQQIMNTVPISKDKLIEVANVIQHAWRKFKERQQREKQMLFGMVDWRIAARSAIALYRKAGVSVYEANQAATLIKAAYKGYYTRRMMKRLLNQGLYDEAAQGVSEVKEEETTVTLEQSEAEIETITQYMTIHEEDHESVSFTGQLGIVPKSDTIVTTDTLATERKSTESAKSAETMVEAKVEIAQFDEIAGEFNEVEFAVQETKEEEGAAATTEAVEPEEAAEYVEDEDEITEEAEGELLPPPNTEDLVSEADLPPTDTETEPETEQENATSADEDTEAEEAEEA